jgi:hypothetical protein
LAENIDTVYMDENNTKTGYLVKFLNKVFIGAADTVNITDEASVEIIRDDED